MTKKRKTKSGSGNGLIGRLFAQTKLPAHVTEEQDWYLDTPDVRLTRVFTIVLILHVVAVGGILAFKMIEKASTPATVAANSSMTPTVEPSKTDPKETASAQPETDATSASGTKLAESKPVTKRAEEMKAGLVMEHPSAPGYRQYRVAAGDNLIGIAREMKVSAAGLRELNQLSEDTRLTPGKWLMIPGSAKEETAPPKKSNAKSSTEGRVAKADPKPSSGVRPIESKPVVGNANPSSSTDASTYEVQKGDTFFGIARQFGLDYKELMAANGIETPEGLQAGMELQIPGN